MGQVVRRLLVGIGNRDVQHQGVQFQCGKACACGRTNPFDAPERCGGRTIRQVKRTAVRARQEPNDISFTSGEREHALTATSNEERRIGVLDRRGEVRELGDAIIRSCQRHCFPGQESFEERYRFGQPAHPYIRGIKRDMRGRIVLFEIARTKTQLESSVRQDIEGRSFARQQRGVAEVIREHVAANAQRW